MAHWRFACRAVQMHHRGVWKVLVLDFLRRAFRLAPGDLACSHSPEASSRLLVVCLRGRAAELAAVWALQDLRAEGELGPARPGGPRQDLTNPDRLHAGLAWRRLHHRPRSLRSRP